MYPAADASLSSVTCRLYTPSTPFDPRKVAKLGRNWSSGGGGVALATGARVASVPLSHAQDGPRGTAGFSLVDSEATEAPAHGNAPALSRPGGLAASLNTPRFNTQVSLALLGPWHKLHASV